MAAPSRIVDDESIWQYFAHHGHRTSVPQRALQAHADPWLGYTELRGSGDVFSELSPYVSDRDWSDLTEPAQVRPVIDISARKLPGCVDAFRNGEIPGLAASTPLS